VLDAWDDVLPKFVKVIPRDYKRMLAAIARADDQGLVGEEAIMVAFERTPATRRGSAATERARGPERRRHGKANGIHRVPARAAG
jgi:hypothetical protein